MLIEEALSLTGMNKSELADRLGISRAAVSLWKEVPANRIEAIKKLEGVGSSREVPQPDDLAAVRRVSAILMSFNEKDRERIIRWALERLS